SRRNQPPSVPITYLLVHSRNSPLLAQSKILVNDKAIFLIDKSKLPEGVTHFTIFDEALQPVCERLSFKQPAPSLNISGQADQKLYGPRQKISLMLSASASGKAVDADMSVAVVKSDSANNLQPANISTYLSLTSELKGAVQSPEYYFSSEEKA